MHLTIAIPTFNRNEYLVNTLNRLLPQITQNCQLLIIDNASDVPVISTIQAVLDSFPDVNCRVIRNKVNIGGNANLLRCFEECNTDWLWLLGDDDFVTSDAVTSVSTHIELYPDSIFINFSSPSLSRTTTVVTKGTSQFAEKLDSFSNLLFMSAGVYKASTLLPQIKYGYLYSYSWAPHIATLIPSIGDNGVCCFSHVRIVEDYMQAPISQYWSPIGPMLGKMVLLDLPMDSHTRKVMALKLNYKPSLEYLAVYFIQQALQSADINAELYLYDNICLKLYYYGSNLSKKFRVAIYRAMIKYPKIGDLIVKNVICLLSNTKYFQGSGLSNVVVRDQWKRI